MKFLKRLAFNFIRDDIENVLKAHDKAITDHYHKIIDDVEDLEEKLNDLQRQITQNSISARDVASEIASAIDTLELVEDLTPKIAALIDYSILYKMSMSSLAKWAKDNC